MSDLFLVVVSLIGGLVLLVGGGELLVRGASQLSLALHVSPLVVGLTVVAFGTSSPELAVSLESAFLGNADIAIGNIVGSNIFNVLFILGLSSLIIPLAVSSKLVQRDVPVMILASLLVLVVAWDGYVGRWEGLLLFAGILAYTAYCIRESRQEPPQVVEEFGHAWPAKGGRKRQVVLQLVMVAIGLSLLVAGAKLFVAGSVSIANRLGVSDLVIGVTVVAIGTSLPEVMTSIVAAIRGERDIAVGNVVGSNIFNILGVLGLSSAISRESIEVSSVALSFDVPVMIGVAMACLPIFFTGHLISRWEGVLFLLLYATYTIYLILRATESPWQTSFTNSMAYIVLPLTLLSLAIGLWRNARVRRKADSKLG